MNTQERKDFAKGMNQPMPEGVQRDSETPIPQKPSFLFIFSATIVVVTLILATAGAYFGISH